VGGVRGGDLRISEDVLSKMCTYVSHRQPFLIVSYLRKLVRRAEKRKKCLFFPALLPFMFFLALRFPLDRFLPCFSFSRSLCSS